MNTLRPGAAWWLLGPALGFVALFFVAPVVALLLLGNLLVAVATRSAPQLGAMSVGPAALLVGFLWALPLLFEALLARALVTLDAGQGLL